MKVFISWSGQRSRKLAKGYYEWMKIIFPKIEFYMSTEDIESGVRWRESIFAKLQSSNFGIIFLTPENLSSPRLNFEAGAISKVITGSRVVPMLFDLRPADIRGPLDQFQAVSISKDGIYKVLHDINKALDDEKVASHHIDAIFNSTWPKMEQIIKDIEPDIKVVSVAAFTAPPEQKLRYPIKCRVNMRNDTVKSVDISMLDYIPNTVTLKGLVQEVVQVQIGNWYPTPNGVSRIAVLPGQLFRVWIGIDESKFTSDQVNGLRGEIGTVVLSVDNEKVHITI